MTAVITITIGVLTSIGGLVVGVVLYAFLSEIIRAVRQSHRVATVHVRVGLGERRRPTWREWWYCFGREIFRSYTYLTIGFVQIPHNPSKRMRGAYHG